MTSAPVLSKKWKDIVIIISREIQISEETNSATYASQIWTQASSFS